MGEVSVLDFDLTDQSVGLIWMDYTGLDAALWKTVVIHSAAEPIVQTQTNSSDRWEMDISFSLKYWPKTLQSVNLC